jgi:hypothetical protein
MRDDSLGLFWEDVQTKQKGNVYARPIPAIPDTGWVAPAEFPRLADAKLLGLDCETKDISLVEKGPGFRRTGDEGAYIVGIAVGTPDGGRWYFPMRHSIAAEQNLNPDAVLAWARDNLCSPGQVKVGANLSYDVDALWSEGVPVTGPFIDVQHAEALLDPNRYTFNLEALGRSYVGEGKVCPPICATGWNAHTGKTAATVRISMPRRPALSARMRKATWTYRCEYGKSSASCWNSS